MVHIPLVGGKYAIIDNEDLELVSDYKWRFEKNRNDIYAIATLKNKARNIRMHRLIMKAQKGKQIDHINHNGLDNRKCNLRFVTDSQNRQNCFPFRNCLSKYKGISWNRNLKKWTCTIQHNKKHISLGYYHNEIIAGWVYDQMAKKLFGEYARLNFC